MTVGWPIFRHGLPIPRAALGQHALAALFGALGVFAYAPFEQFWLSPLLACGLLLLLLNADGVRAAARLGFAFGLGFFLAGVSWVYVSLSVFGNMPALLAGLGTLLFCAALALYPALAAAVFKRWQPVGAVQQALFFAGCFAFIDWLRGWLLTGFPWLAWGYAHTAPSPLAGYAPVLGVFGVSWLCLLLGGLLRAGRRGGVAVLLILLLGVALRQVAWTQPVGPVVPVALVQGNVAQDLKWRPEVFIRTLLHYLDLVERHPAQLTILPETAVPGFIDHLPPEFMPRMQALALRQAGDVLIGAVTRQGQTYWNSAVSVGASPTQVASKAHLVPFGEFIPPGFSWFLKLAEIPMADFARGQPEQSVLHLAGLPVAVNICYEDAFGEELIAALPTAGVLVNMSNTAWFGASLAQPQHLQIARWRAMETGRPMLRATNTGMTAAIAPDGEVEAVLPPFVTGVLKAEVRAYGGLTPYARYGNRLAVLLILLAGGLSLRRRGGSNARSPAESK